MSEVSLFLNVYTQTAYFDGQGQAVPQPVRSDYLTLFARYTYGIRSNWNVGVEGLFRSVRVDSLPAPFWNIFRFGNSANSRTAITHIGPVLRWSLRPGYSPFTVQSTFYIPVARDLEGRDGSHPFLEYQGSLWWTQFQFTFPVHRNIWGFAGMDALVRWNEANGIVPFQAGGALKGFLTLLPNNRMALYVNAEFAPTMSGFKGYYLQAGGGIKVFLGGVLELETLATKFLAGRNSGAGSTLNAGSRVRW